MHKPLTGLMSPMRKARLPALVAAALVLALAGCSQKPKDVAEAPPAGTQPAAAAAVPAVDPNAPPPVCTTGRTKAVTNICDDADPALFRQVNPDHPLLSPKCVWYTEQVMLAGNEALLFRVQDCSAEGWDGEAYAWADGKLKAGAASTPYAIDRVVLEILGVGKNQDPRRVAIQTLITAPDDERTRCIIRPVEDAMIRGETFEIAPDDDFMAELTSAQGERWTACGDYGVGPGVQLFEVRGGGRLFFHRMADSPGYWDPASFTLYRPDGAGAWKKSAE